MKKILFLLTLIATAASGQSPKSCCKISSTEKFGMLAMNDRFVASHLDPEPFVFTPVRGAMIKMNCKDGSTANAYEVKADKPSNRWIIMIHEWWGLNDYIRQEAEAEQKDLSDCNVLAIDLYDGKVASVSDDAKKLMNELKQERALMIIQAAIAYCGSQASIGTIGWCMGGAWSLQTAIEAGDKAKACVMYYGSPETDLDRLRKLQAPVLGIFASKDEWIGPKVVSQFQLDMASAGKKLTVKSYEADHAFANPSNPKFDKGATADARAAQLAFFREHLK